MDSQCLGRLGEVLAALLQGLDNVFFFHFANGFLFFSWGLLIMEIAWQVFGVYMNPLAEDEGVLNYILQLPDVAGIRVIHEKIHDLFGDALDLLPCLLVELRDEVFNEEGDVHPALFQTG